MVQNSHSPTAQLLIDGETIAIDSFKVRRQNSLKNNFNDKKIIRHKEYIDNKISGYEQALDSSNNEEEKKVKVELDMESN